MTKLSSKPNEIHDSRENSGVTVVSSSWQWFFLVALRRQTYAAAIHLADRHDCNDAGFPLSFLCDRMKLPIASLLLAALCSSSLGQAVKDREGAVRNDRAAMENDQRWIYNDYQRGFEQAKETGKPLLIVMRCIPCLACSGIDAQVLMKQTDLDPLLDQFVCVRVINANAIDLSKFQFDYDLSFSTLFFNADGTLYGRYGSWTHQKQPDDKTTAGFKKALQAALDIHHGYPANKASLTGKQGAEVPFKTPVEIPTLAGRYRIGLDWNGKVVPSCVHCHQVGDAFRTWYRSRKETIPEKWIYPQPAPETIGMKLASESIAHVDEVEPRSIAAKAGLQPGDDFVSIQGEPLVSIADVSWILNNAGETDSLRAVVRRNGEQKSITLDLPPGWRQHTDISHRVATWSMRAMALGGLVLEDLDNDQRQERSIDRGSMALWVKNLGQYGQHAAAKNAGFKKGDVLVAIDGQADRTTEGEMIGYLLKHHQPGESVEATVLRGADRLKLTLPMQ